jgi:hypothetical protein
MTGLSSGAAGAGPGVSGGEDRGSLIAREIGGRGLTAGMERCLI